MIAIVVGMVNINNYIKSLLLLVTHQCMYYQLFDFFSMIIMFLIDSTIRPLPQNPVL